MERLSMHSFVYYEKKQHGTKEFPAEYYYVDSKHPRYIMSAHWHTEWELIRIKSGSFSAFVDETEIHAKAGDVILLRESMLHSGVPQDCTYECFVFDLLSLSRTAEIVKRTLRPVYSETFLMPVYFPAGKNKQIGQFVDLLMESSAKVAGSVTDKEFWELSVWGHLCNLFSFILLNKLYIPAPEESLHKSSRIGQIKAVLSFIEQNYGSAISLNDLANLVNMNPRYFCRVFQEVVKQTPMDYVISYRIEQAAIMLVTTQTSITDIAMASGFNDHSYFTKTFKRINGVTPRAYRKEFT